MSFQTGVGQDLLFVTVSSSDHLTPTEPANPVVTINKGAGWVAPAGTFTSHGKGLCALAATNAEMNAPWLAVNVKGDNIDEYTHTFYTEAGYTAARAANLDNLDAAVSALGQGNGPVPLTVTVRDNAGLLVAGARVALHNDALTDAGLLGYSDGNGQVVFSVDPGVYRVTIRDTIGYTAAATGYPVTVLVSPTSLVATVTSRSLPAPADPSLCRCYCYMRRSAGGDMLGPGEGVLSVLGIGKRPEGDTSLYSTADTCKTDGTGLAYLDLPRGLGCSLQATWPQGLRVIVAVTVPDADAYDLGALLQ
jgi:hypothetical protein